VDAVSELNPIIDSLLLIVYKQRKLLGWVPFQYKHHEMPDICLAYFIAVLLFVRSVLLFQPLTVNYIDDISTRHVLFC